MERQITPAHGQSMKHTVATQLLSAVFLVGLLLSAASVAAQQPSTITVYVTVDWEGTSLNEENIEAMQAFRRQYPHIPMLQFLNPVYFLRPGADAAVIHRKILSTLLPSDEQGLHLHPWKSLITRCGLPYRSTPAFATLDEECGEGDCGYTVSLEYAYTQQELTQLVACSADLMASHGFERPRSFRAGGWQLGSKMAAALQANGFTFDSSRTDAWLLTSRWDANSGLVQLLLKLHPDSTPLDQPYELLPGLMEFPNNGSLADYTSPQKLLEIFRSLIANRKTVLVLGFHQETAFDYLRRLEDAIPLLENEAEMAGVKLEWAHYH
jgi:hypothetical protein